MIFMDIVNNAAPDTWVEGATAIIISVLSWWLGRQKEKRKLRRGR